MPNAELIDFLSPVIYNQMTEWIGAPSAASNIEQISGEEEGKKNSSTSRSNFDWQFQKLISNKPSANFTGTLGPAFLPIEPIRGIAKPKLEGNIFIIKEPSNSLRNAIPPVLIPSVSPEKPPIRTTDGRNRIGSSSNSPTVVVSPIGLQVLSERHVAEIEDGFGVAADEAVRDALVLLENGSIGGSPDIMFSEDGILSLEWRQNEYGVALVFSGDGLASVGIKRPGQLYAQNGIDVPVTEPLPQSLLKVFALVNG